MVIPEIRAAQEESVSAVEAQLAKRSPFILVNGRPISPEAAWAATQAIRKAWSQVGGRYDGQQKLPSGEWLARIEFANGDLRLVSIGRFPGYDEGEEDGNH